ncbi:MAG: glycosyl hydrolase [Lewinellaceae bacterium]|nr:glycosyl hydrolase [Lewinellaceae bacterium]
MIRKITPLSFIFLLFVIQAGNTQDRGAALWADSTFSGLEFRSIGPAFMAGRIADIAIHPENDNLWYVAVGSGGVWKTANAGVTWKPIFDDQSSYSIGCVTIDPSNPHTIWVGTGENVGGRHVGYGDGVYRSTDGGQSWKNMGLKASEHISKIVVHPKNSDVIWVAAQGPLWSKGGERGLYKSTDGGQNWKKVLGDEEWVGATDLVLDPRDPNRLYAATWQRHRTVAALMDGGPGTAIYRSNDGGESWEKLSKGLPKSNMGKIGLAISPQEPDVVYAAIEMDRRTGGVYRSTDRGASWEKRSDAVSGATGPHYYQELYASPHQAGRLYLMDVRIQVSDDGGKTFRRLKEEYKHSDNHAIAFRMDDPDYLLVGTDGGLYESFDLAENWRFIANMPITQYYKVAVDDAEPFYNLYGGTQDNNTHGGPSRTDNLHGIRNADWFITVFADGHQPATEPGNPDIVYSEWQQGNLVRTDRTTGEVVYIQPQPEAGEGPERFNWDSPILVSPHAPTRLYFASQRVWRSDNRGDSWRAISSDLTRNQERIELPIMGKNWSWDSPWDFLAMSTYNTITSLAESPKQEGLIYAGTDDGIIQVTEDGGANWRKIEVGSLPGVPKTAFVNDIKADLFDANTVYVALDNHKYGDFKPYLLKSADRGKTWASIAGNIPDRTLVWRLVQDHVKPGLLFAATEFGIYFTPNGGQRWVKLTGGVPTISFRDLAIQRRENDLVGASFGRSFYVLDDYSVLREVTAEQLQGEAALFSTRRAWWYIPRAVLDFDDAKGSQGSGYYIAPNPAFGATFTYYLKDGLKTKAELRKEKEKAMSGDVPFPGWDAVEEERRQEEPKIWLTVADEQGNVIRRLEGPVKKGFHRVSWDLRYPAPQAITVDQRPPRGDGDDDDGPVGFMAPPGTYTVTLSKQEGGTVTILAGPASFEVERLREGALPGAAPEQVAAFWRELEDVQGEVSATAVTLRGSLNRTKAMQLALSRTPGAPGALDEQLHGVRQALLQLDEALNGNRAKQEVGEKTPPTVQDRLRTAVSGTRLSTYGPSPMHRRSLEIARSGLSSIKAELSRITGQQIPQLEKAMAEAGAPWIEGQALPVGEK